MIIFLNIKRIPNILYKKIIHKNTDFVFHYRYILCFVKYENNKTILKFDTFILFCFSETNIIRSVYIFRFLKYRNEENIYNIMLLHFIKIFYF